MHRFAMQDSTTTLLDLYPEVWRKAHVDDNNRHSVGELMEVVEKAELSAKESKLPVCPCSHLRQS